MATGRQRSSSQAEYFLKKSILEYKENKEGFPLKIRICTEKQKCCKQHYGFFHTHNSQISKSATRKVQRFLGLMREE